jgi:hypothetical protein
MWDDPVVEEVRRIRDQYAAQFGYDLDAILRDLEQREESNQRETVALPPKKPALVNFPR